MKTLTFLAMLALIVALDVAGGNHVGHLAFAGFDATIGAALRLR